jgi:hypothetical protein
MDTVLEYPGDQKFIYVHGNSISSLKVPFGYKSILHLDSKGNIYWGKTDRTYIQVFSKYDKRANKINVDHHNIKIPAKYITAVNSQLQGSTFGKKLLKSGKIPEYLPNFAWFLIDSHNRVWIALNTKDLKNYLLKVFDQNGNEIGVTKLSKRIKLQVIRNGYAYGVKADKKGKQSVIRYKIKGL